MGLDHYVMILMQTEFSNMWGKYFLLTDYYRNEDVKQEKIMLL